MSESLFTVGALFFALLAGIISNELYDWVPAVTRRVLAAAARRFRDPSLRERACEEWQETLSSIPGKVAPLLHAVSLFVSVRRVERAWTEAPEPPQLDEVGLQRKTFEVQAAVDAFAATLKVAREAVGLSLEQVSAKTRISVNYLQAMEAARFERVPQGVYMRSYLSELARTVGLDPNRVFKDYSSLLPKNTKNVFAQGAHAAGWSSRFACRVMGHPSFTRYFHREGAMFHWAHYECERCGCATPVWAELCPGRKQLVKLGIDEPATERYTCEREWAVMVHRYSERAEDRWRFALG